MSTYWYLHCKSCNIDHAAGNDIGLGFNRRPDLLRAIYGLREHIVAIYDQSDMNTVRIEDHDISSWAWFLREHGDHELDIINEYGAIRSIEEATL